MSHPKYDNMRLLDLVGDSLHLPYLMNKNDVVDLCDKFAIREFSELIHKCMHLAYDSGQLCEDDGLAVLKFKD